jgi:hypothetical protein
MTIWIDKDEEEWTEVDADRLIYSGKDADNPEPLRRDYVESTWGPLRLKDEPLSYILVISDGWYTRAEGPMYEHQAMTRRAELWDSVSGLSIQMIVAGRWDGGDDDE